MGLNERIREFQKGMLAQVPPEALKVFASTTASLVKSGLAEKALKKGDTIPSFSLPNAKGDTVSSLDLLKKGPLVIDFYRGAWCPYCNLELKALQEALPEIKNLGAQLVAISPNKPDKSLTSIEKHSLTFEVLSDAGNKTAKEFNLVFELAEALRPLYKQFGFSMPDFNGDESYELPMPATYVVDPRGTIELAFIDADYTRRLEPDEVVKALKGMKKQALPS